VLVLPARSSPTQRMVTKYLIFMVIWHQYGLGGVMALSAAWVVVLAMDSVVILVAVGESGDVTGTLGSKF